MQLYTPSNEQELAIIETQIQSALATTLDFNLKRPEKLRELTCRILGFPNGYQQLKTAMEQASQSENRLSDAERNELEDFVLWMRTSTKAVLSAREVEGGQPDDVENFLVHMMDELVFEWVGTGKHVSDSVNNAGLEAQVTAVKKAGTVSPIIWALAEQLSECEGIEYSWATWRKTTLLIPDNYRILLDDATGRWSWYDDIYRVWSHDIFASYGGKFQSRTAAINDAITADKYRDHQI